MKKCHLFDEFWSLRRKKDVTDSDGVNLMRRFTRNKEKKQWKVVGNYLVLLFTQWISIWCIPSSDLKPTLGEIDVVASAFESI